MDLTRHIGSHQIGVIALQQLFVEAEGRRNVFGRNPSNRESDVVEHVVARGDRLIHDVEPHTALDTPKIDDRDEVVHFDDTSRYA